ncbi:MAG TPA: hypothetical protein VHR45_20875 [Thermoanaerobaculia bacterium]|nr:hypothetical protein [Thermoanaerobaculia bacterium]
MKPFDPTVEILPPNYAGNDFMAVFRAKTAATKGEFETSKQFQQRASSLGGDLYAFRFAAGLKYDADRQAFIVHPYITGVYTGETLYSRSSSDSALLIRDSDVVTGHYLGSNAMGAKVRVRMDTETNLAIVVPGDLTSQPNDLSVRMSPEKARRDKAALAFLYVCQPIARDTGITKTVTVHIEPEIATPLERTLVFRYIFVDHAEIWIFDKNTGEILLKHLLGQGPKTDSPS